MELEKIFTKTTLKILFTLYNNNFNSEGINICRLSLKCDTTYAGVYNRVLFLKKLGLIEITDMKRGKGSPKVIKLTEKGLGICKLLFQIYKLLEEKLEARK